MKDALNPPWSQLIWHAATHPGRYRRRNEDAFLLLNFDAQEVRYLGKEGQSHGMHEHFMFAVSDGIGGGVGGHHASQSALKLLVPLVSKMFHQKGLKGEIPFAELLVSFTRHIHESLLSMSRHYQECERMGATLTLGWVHEARLHFAHLGDSRIYLIREGQACRQLTEDHTLAAQRVKEGKMTPQQARRDERAHVLTKSIGIVGRPDEPQLGNATLQPGDSLVFCTDGLSDALPDYRIAATLNQPPPSLVGLNPVERLIREALDGSGRDNMTGIVVQCLH